MFNGIIENIGTINNINKEKNLIDISTHMDLNDCREGSSISCDGICLTIFNIIKSKKNYIFSSNISEETYLRSTIKYWQKNTKINLEKSLKLNQEISGHFVYGHIDGISEVLEIKTLDNSWDIFFSYISKNNKNFIVEKGSVAINGISLTISKKLSTSFCVSIIPHTFKQTNLSNLKKKDKVNLEFDMIARYIFNR